MCEHDKTIFLYIFTNVYVKNSNALTRILPSCKHPSRIVRRLCRHVLNFPVDRIYRFYNGQWRKFVLKLFFMFQLPLDISENENSLLECKRANAISYKCRPSPWPRFCAWCRYCTWSVCPPIDYSKRTLPSLTTEKRLALKKFDRFPNQKRQTHFI